MTEPVHRGRAAQWSGTARGLSAPSFRLWRKFTPEDICGKKKPGSLWPLSAVLALAACGVQVPDLPVLGGSGGGTEARLPAGPPPIASVRHVESTEPWAGGRLHLFLFQPEAPRPLQTRLDAARAAVAAEPSCEWIEAPTDVIVAETGKQGAAYAETVLVAPLACI